MSLSRLDKFKQSDIHVPTFLALSTGYFIFKYDMSCSDILGTLVKIIFPVNLYGFLVTAYSVFRQPNYDNSHNIILAILILIYDIFNTIVFIVVFFLFFINEAKNHETCESDQTLEIYFIWMVTTLIWLIIRGIYSKYKRSAKMDEQGMNVIRGSATLEDAIMRNSVKPAYHEQIK